MKLVKTAEGAQAIAPMTRLDWAAYYGHEAALMTIGWGAPAAAAAPLVPEDAYRPIAEWIVSDD
jgi:hypothetical protein